jgi:hypothetical protein
MRPARLGVACRPGLVAEQEGFGLRHADQARQGVHNAEVRHQPEPHEAGHELCALRRIHDVARDRDADAAAHRDTIHADDHGLGAADQVH